MTLPEATDGLSRCRWAGSDPLYCRYHDEEWGVPQRDPRLLWETLMLEGFQAGLSWITILRRREAFRVAFAGFDPERVARFGEADIARLLADSAIIRSRAKIEATIGGARAWLAMREAGEEFGGFLWSFVGGEPVVGGWRHESELAAETELSRRLSRVLKQRGFKFVGPVITYAFLQAAGLVDDHVATCFRARPAPR